MPKRIVSRVRNDGKYTQRDTPVHEMYEERAEEMAANTNFAVEKRTIATESIEDGSKLQGRARNPKYHEKRRKMANQDGGSSHDNDISRDENNSNTNKTYKGAIMKKHIVQNVEKYKIIQENNVKIARKAIKMDPKMEDINQVQNLISSKNGEQVSKMANTRKKVTITMPEHKSKMAERKKNLKKFNKNEMADVQCTWRPNENIEMTNMQYGNKPEAKMMDTQLSEESSKEKVNMAEIPRGIQDHTRSYREPYKIVIKQN